MLSLKHRLLILKIIYESKPIDFVLVFKKLLDLSIDKFHEIMNNYVQELDYLFVVMFNRC